MISDQIYKIFHEKNSVQRRFARATFEVWQKFGFHVVGDHFYDPIPNTQTIKQAYRSDIRSLPALVADWPKLADTACTVIEAHLDDYLENRTAVGYVEDNNFFTGLDALYYYSFIKERKPNRIIEIGQGVSTRIAIAALAQNINGEQIPELITIDPYSRLSINTPPDIRYTVLQKPLQEIQADISVMLGSGDLLFVDSSHVFKFASDVQLLFEQVYPNLADGVFIHIHDIFTPFNYPIDWMTKKNRFWNEQYFLESFLFFNTRFTIETPIHYIARTSKIEDLLSRKNVSSSVVRREGSSIYLIKHEPK